MKIRHDDFDAKFALVYGDGYLITCANNVICMRRFSVFLSFYLTVCL